VCLALVTRLTSSKRRGTAVGYFGLITGTPSVIFPSIGLWLLGANHLELAVAVSFFAAAIGAVLGLFVRLPRSVATGGGTNILVAIRRPGILVIFISLALFSSAYGGVFTYIPLSLTASGLGSAAQFFLISGACRAVGRWLFGLLGNSRSGRQILIGGIALATIGLSAVAVSVQPYFVLFAAVAYGLGSGAVQTGSYLSLAERSTPSEWDMVSALWNIALDFGSAAGSAVMGLAAATYGYSLGVWLMPAIVALSLPMVVRAGAHKADSVPALDMSVTTPMDDARR
jgi:predicted MFS family arabinose efflux permease